MYTVTKLNDLAVGSILDNISPEAVMIPPWGDMTSTTICFNRGDAFALEDIKAVPICLYNCDNPKHVVPADYKGVVAIHRIALSLSSIERMNEQRDLNQVLEKLINAAKVDLINQIGSLRGYKLSAKQDKQQPYFQLMENYNGVELRIYVIKE